MIIILAYIASIFLNRWLNYRVFKILSHYPKTCFLWFLPIIPAMSFIFIILSEYKFKNNWFTGKYWK